MAQPRADMAAVTMGDTLLLIGGSVPGATVPVATQSVIRFSLSNHVWLSDAPPLNIPRISPEAVIEDGYVLVFGGRRDEENYVSEIEAWRPGQPQWTVVGNLYPARAGMRAVHIDGNLYLTGGASGPLEQYNRFDRIIPYLSSNPIYVSVQASSDTLPSPRSHHGLAWLNDELYCFGGFSIWPLRDNYIWDGGAWELADSLVSGVGDMAFAPFQFNSLNVLVVSGGRSLDGEIATMQFGFEEGFWELGSYITALPTARKGHVMVPYERDLFMFGGSYQNVSGQKVLLGDVMHLRRIALDAPEPGTPTEFDLQLSAHPNPSNGAVTITIVPEAGASDLDVRLYNLLGQQVARWSPTVRGGQATVSWSGMSPGGDAAGGLYFVVARSGGRQKALKLFRLP